MSKQPIVKKPHRPLFEIAAEIIQDIDHGLWSKQAAFHASPYLAAMKELHFITDDYYADSGKSVVLYFLSNAATWRGETARRIKAELRSMAA